MKDILIVEDDQLIAELERDYLEASDFQVDIASDGNIGMEMAMQKKYDALVLDIMLPGKNGYEICREVRKTSNVPIIMVTAKREDIDKIRGLGMGVDDYVVKPFSPSELVARIKAHISMHERLQGGSGSDAKDDTINIKELKIMPQAYRVFVRDKEITLTNKEFELLLFLAENPNIVFSKDRLFDSVWGMDSLGDASTVIVHINRLREKLEDDASKPSYIETVWGAGYRFKID